MNVKELIDALQLLPQDSMVVVSGYEGGVDEVGIAEESKVNLNVNDAWYYGSHEIEENGGTPVVYIS